MINDTGVSFDPSQRFTESSLGIPIMRSFLDDGTGVAGSPRVLTVESKASLTRFLWSKSGRSQGTLTGAHS
jgi:hypothetical protein